MGKVLMDHEGSSKVKLVRSEAIKNDSFGFKLI